MSSALDGVAIRDPVVKERLDDQIKWYETHGRESRILYKSLKAAQILAAALVPIVTAVEAIRTDMPWVIAALGGAVIVVESTQQLGHFHENWLRFALSSEALKREKYLHLARAGDYGDAENPDVLLAERVEELSARETGLWLRQERTAAKKAQDKG